MSSRHAALNMTTMASVHNTVPGTLVTKTPELQGAATVESEISSYEIIGTPASVSCTAGSNCDAMDAALDLLAIELDTDSHLRELSELDAEKLACRVFEMSDATVLKSRLVGIIRCLLSTTRRELHLRGMVTSGHTYLYHVVGQLGVLYEFAESRGETVQSRGLEAYRN